MASRHPASPVLPLPQAIGAVAPSVVTPDSNFYCSGLLRRGTIGEYVSIEYFFLCTRILIYIYIYILVLFVLFLHFLINPRAGRPLVYFTFGDHKLMCELRCMQELVARQKITIGESSEIIQCDVSSMIW